VALAVVFGGWNGRLGEIRQEDLTPSRSRYVALRPTSPHAPCRHASLVDNLNKLHGAVFAIPSPQVWPGHQQRQSPRPRDGPGRHHRSAHGGGPSAEQGQCTTHGDCHRPKRPSPCPCHRGICTSPLTFVPRCPGGRPCSLYHHQCTTHLRNLWRGHPGHVAAAPGHSTSTHCPPTSPSPSPHCPPTSPHCPEPSTSPNHSDSCSTSPRVDRCGSRRAGPPQAYHQANTDATTKPGKPSVAS
jgi:hypothetical protein